MSLLSEFKAFAVKGNVIDLGVYKLQVAEACLLPDVPPLPKP